MLGGQGEGGGLQQHPASLVLLRCLLGRFLPDRVATSIYFWGKEKTIMRVQRRQEAPSPWRWVLEVRAALLLVGG